MTTGLYWARYFFLTALFLAVAYLLLLHFKKER
jgi:hypothetical protein